MTSRSRDIANLLGTGSVILDGAPSALDTLNELAAAIGDDANYASTISTSISNINSSLSGKENSITSGTTGQYWRGDKSWQTLDKTSVGLSNVENTALSTWAGSTNITTLGTVTNVTSPTSAGSAGVRKITMSTSNPTGGADGDVWFVYV
jgi:hypothetical protein